MKVVAHGMSFFLVQKHTTSIHTCTTPCWHKHKGIDQSAFCSAPFLSLPPSHPHSSFQPEVVADGGEVTAEIWSFRSRHKTHRHTHPPTHTQLESQEEIIQHYIWVNNLGQEDNYYFVFLCNSERGRESERVREREREIQGERNSKRE